jgi:hypothetical protein
MSYRQTTSPYGGGHCPDRGEGFQSQARPASIGGCAPGTVPPMCDTARRITGAKAGPGLETIELGPYQSLQLLAIVDLAATPGVTVDELLTDGESTFSKFKVDQGQAFVVDGLGDLSNLTPALYNAGLNPIPPTPLNDALNQLSIVLNSAVGGEPFDFLVFFGNPAHRGHMMQKGSAGNY